MFVEVRGHGATVLSLVHAVVELFGPDLARIIGVLADSSEWILASHTPYLDEKEAVEVAEERVSVWEERDYDVFACLAGVRNGESIDPISPPRGFPFDLSKAVASIGVEHTPSFLSLNELDPNTNPDFWNEPLAKRRKMYNGDAWCSTYREAYMPTDMEEWIRTLREYQRKHKIPDDFIRVVFFFDS